MGKRTSGLSLSIAVAAALSALLATAAIAATIVGTDGRDQITGTPQDDQIDAKDGNDRVRALDGDDDVLGGRGKDQDFTALRGRAHAIYLIGEDADRIGREAGGQLCGDLATAVGRARGAARPGEIVLLSPACASFDQFDDFEARGRAFRALVAG